MVDFVPFLGVILILKFDISKFFEQYPKILLGQNNKKIVEFTKNWLLIHQKVCGRKKWTCEICGIKKLQNKDELHVVHINGVKSDNRIKNLKVLCQSCLSQESRNEIL